MFATSIEIIIGLYVNLSISCTNMNNQCFKNMQLPVVIRPCIESMEYIQLRNITLEHCISTGTGQAKIFKNT